MLLFNQMANRARTAAAKVVKFSRNPVRNTQKGMHDLGEKVWPPPKSVPDRGRPELYGGARWATRRLPLAVGVALVYSALHPAPASPDMKIPEHTGKPPSAAQLAEMHKWADAETLATPFGEKCGIVQVTDTHRNPHLRDGKPRTTVVIKVQAPLSEQAKDLYPKYQGRSATSWKPPVGVGFVLPPDHPEIYHSDHRVADDNGKNSSDIKNGDGTIVLFPPTDVEDGTRVGVFARVDVTTHNMGQDWRIHGDTPCGELVMAGKTDGDPHWEMLQGGPDMSAVITADPVEQ
jgi:hypothetical protein